MDYRVPVEIILLKKQSKKTVKVELFSALDWRQNRRPGGRNMYPQPPWRSDGWWESHYRLRIDGRWYGRSRKKYHFFSRGEVFEVISLL